MDLLANLCDVMGLFPAASEEAVGELVGRMMAERLRGEVAERKRRVTSATARRQKPFRRKT